MQATFEMDETTVQLSQVIARMEDSSDEEGANAVYRRPSLGRAASAPLSSLQPAADVKRSFDSDGSASSPIDIVSRYTFDSPQRRVSDRRRRSSSAHDVRGSTQDLLSAVSNQTHGSALDGARERPASPDARRPALPRVDAAVLRIGA